VPPPPQVSKGLVHSGLELHSTHVAVPLELQTLPPDCAHEPEVNTVCVVLGLSTTELLVQAQALAMHWLGLVATCDCTQSLFEVPTPVQANVWQSVELVSDGGSAESSTRIVDPSGLPVQTVLPQSPS